MCQCEQESPTVGFVIFGFLVALVAVWVWTQ